jgi:hypothetical protein
VATWYFRRASRIRSWPNPGHNLDWVYKGREESCYHATPQTASTGYVCDVSLTKATEQGLLVAMEPVSASTGIWRDAIIAGLVVALVGTGFAFIYSRRRR